MVVQDDNFVYQRTSILEAVTFMEKSSRAVIVGGLAGVNFYPRGTEGLEGPGQIAVTENEVYWRQDGETDPGTGGPASPASTPACAGRSSFSKAFLDEHGYLDEAFAPAICRRHGHLLPCRVGGPEGLLHSDEGHRERFPLAEGVTTPRRRDGSPRSCGATWTSSTAAGQPSTEKDHLWLHRIPIADETGVGTGIARFSQRARRRYLAARRRWLHAGMAVQALGCPTAQTACLSASRLSHPGALPDPRIAPHLPVGPGQAALDRAHARSRVRRPSVELDLGDSGNPVDETPASSSLSSSSYSPPSMFDLDQVDLLVIEMIHHPGHVAQLRSSSLCVPRRANALHDRRGRSLVEHHQLSRRLPAGQPVAGAPPHARVCRRSAAFDSARPNDVTGFRRPRSGRRTGRRGRADQFPWYLRAASITSASGPRS